MIPVERDLRCRILLPTLCTHLLQVNVKLRSSTPSSSIPFLVPIDSTAPPSESVLQLVDSFLAKQILVLRLHLCLLAYLLCFFFLLLYVRGPVIITIHHAELLLLCIVIALDRVWDKVFVHFLSI